MTLLTVVMPTYNVANCVAQTIDSLIAQTYPHIELIVVDDGSQDDTVAVIRAKLGSDIFKHKWQVIELGRNSGPSAARNVGLKAAAGEWVHFLDGDDLLAPTKFAIEMERCLQVGPDVSAVYAPFRQCYIEDGNINWEGPLVNPDVVGRPPLLHLIAGFRPLLAASLSRRDILQQIGGFDESLHFWECEEMSFRLAKAGRAERVVSPVPLYLWRLPRQQAYVGGSASRYQAAPVALGWITQVLKAMDGKTIGQLGLAPAEHKAVLDECTFWGRLAYAHDRRAFRAYLAMARKVDPLIAPTGPAHIAFAARYCGYEFAEGFGKLLRMPKAWLRKILQRLNIRPRSVLFDWY